MKISTTSFFLLLMLLSACSTSPDQKNKTISFSAIAKINWTIINKSNAEKYFGKADAANVIYPKKSEEGWVYIGDRDKTAHLSLLFDIQTDKLISANWFFGDTEKNLTLDQLIQQHPNLSFDLEKPEAVNNGAREMHFYSSKDKDFVAAVRGQTNTVSSISWEMPGFKVEKRKPTSH